LQWRLDTTIYWLNLATQNAKKNISTIVSGLCFPSEIKKSSNYVDTLDIYFCLLDVKKNERKKRLKQRNASKEVIDDLKQLDRLRDEFKKLSNCFIINTTEYDIETVAIKVISWIKNMENTSTRT
jgi:hypothetical protein